jgi:hypothetical protein
MQTISGTFAGRVEIRGAAPVGDDTSHQMMLAQVTGPQTSPDPDWNGAVITYTAVLDLAGGTGTQRGYFVNVHVGGDRDWGTFEGAIATVADTLRCDGTWKITGGDGRFERIIGKGSFSMLMPSPETVDTEWEGVYENGISAAGQPEEPTAAEE